MKGAFDRLMHFYDKEYKKLLIIPAILLIFCIIVIGHTYLQTGEYVEKGVSLKGGLTISVFNVNADIDELKIYLSSKFSDLDINVRDLTKTGKQVGIEIDATTQEPEQLLSAIESKLGKLSKDQYTVDITGASLGSSFFKQAIFAIIISFASMAIVVFLYFRSVLPSAYIVICAIIDILFAVAMFNLFNMKLTTAGIAAFLMLIGYSVDTDILLTTRVLKRREGTVEERVRGSMSTGLTMTAAAIASTVVAYFATPSEVMKQIMFILFWGLIADIVNTWITNVSLLRIYLEKKEPAEQHES